MPHPLNILVLGPHPDDQEIGMGGTIAKLAEQGHRVLLVDVTDGCPTPVGDRETRLKEAARAAAILGPREGVPGVVPGGSVARRLLDLPNRKVQHTIEARHLVAGAIRAHQATVLFMPHPEDAHPDHLAVTRIGEDARFDAKLTKQAMPGDEGRPPIYPKWVFYYFCSHLRSVPQPTFIVDTSRYSERKRRAVEAYESQFTLNPKNTGAPAAFATMDAYFGSRIGTPAGEPFWTREPLGLASLDGLVM